MTRGYHIFSSITIWRFIWGLKWKLCDYSKWKLCDYTCNQDLSCVGGRIDASPAISLHLLYTFAIGMHSGLTQWRFTVCYVDAIAGIGKDSLRKRFGPTLAGKLRGPGKSAAADTEGKKTKYKTRHHRERERERERETNKNREAPRDASKCLSAKQVSARLGPSRARTGFLRLVKKAWRSPHFPVRYLKQQLISSP